MHTPRHCPPPVALETPSHREPLNLVVTLAAPYSGATLLALLLNQHSQLSSDGEIFPLGEKWSVLCSCGKAQVECPYYHDVAHHLLGPDGEWDRDWFVPHPRYSPFRLVDHVLGRMWDSPMLSWLQAGTRSLWRQRDREFVDAHLDLMRNSLRLRRARIYVDGTKSVRRALLFAESGRVRMKGIHFIRDGRGFCYSYLKNQKLSRQDLPRAVDTWLKTIRAVDRFRARQPQVPILDVRYEDLCHDVPATLQRICRFLNVPYEPAMASGSVRECHVLGNRMRHTFNGQVEECLRWREEFTSKEIAYLNRVLRSGLERFDYFERDQVPARERCAL